MRHESRGLWGKKIVLYDSYQTLSAAYSAASAGDTIEFSGGTSGKTYLGLTSAHISQEISTEW